MQHTSKQSSAKKDDLYLCPPSTYLCFACSIETDAMSRKSIQKVLEKKACVWLNHKYSGYYKSPMPTTSLTLLLVHFPRSPPSIDILLKCGFKIKHAKTIYLYRSKSPTLQSPSVHNGL